MSSGSNSPDLGSFAIGGIVLLIVFAIIGTLLWYSCRKQRAFNLAELERRRAMVAHMMSKGIQSRVPMLVVNPDGTALVAYSAGHVPKDKRSPSAPSSPEIHADAYQDPAAPAAAAAELDPEMGRSVTISLSLASPSAVL
ncbi:hypothetical protein ACKKBG_A07275 [Auxenochlorella protothecoides x Auxenochlorella symbiontica]